MSDILRLLLMWVAVSLVLAPIVGRALKGPEDDR